VVLPPLIYSQRRHELARVQFNLRPIILLAVGCVIFTAFAVAAATHYLIDCRERRPSCSAPLLPARTWWRRWRSPVSSACRAAFSLSSRAGPGNDATALILYRFALVAISTVCFRCRKATGTFRRSSSAKCCSVRLGWLSLRARHRARDPQVEIQAVADHTLHRLLDSEHFGGSGVIQPSPAGSI